ncbi:MAG TPA: prolyl aminopeptidase [Paracoccus sp. (in: a-proteobacteria)]|uniref:prolyl aminopeptidase n=1 Tax=uncultured Paracoccus sp. TaxID=189685 RepID=UPI00262BBE7A|nr:prolyl aminopeptidase [uncultured Paracoccus sp.]HMQ40831.1 prolyl aminopeptidase [Paracoccus sp. (in: a-proteobacteria)]HMR35484.1 prolyl aminopeptidase [Paracoccus sp. (in: a-proteobacteria)]
MDRTSGQIGAARLYPHLEPFDRRRIEVGDGHVLYVEQSGNPEGQPVIVLHGGPGGGCSPFMRRFFDPAHYRAILFDQRGCGLSTPHASVEANTTPHLVADIEAIRQALGIGQWALFGGSWGATLALAYAEAHPQAVTALILRGVFLGTQAELDWFYGGGAGRFWPERWQDFCAPIPEEERGDMIAAYHRRLFSGDEAEEQRFARHWIMWENGLAGMDIANPGAASPAYARAFARLENHYFRNRCFLDEGQLLRDRARIEHIPCQIVQGRYDMVCPPISAWTVAQDWQNCRLRMVPASGHALSEPRIAAELVEVMNDMR